MVTRKINSIAIAFLFLLFSSCATVKEIPVQTEVQVVEKVVKDTIYVKVPYEVIKEVVPELDTLYMETSVAKSMAYLDTLNKVLQGQMENKPIQLEKEIQYVVRDSIVVRDKPYVVTQEIYKVPNWSWLIIIISVALNCFLIYRAIKD